MLVMNLNSILSLIIGLRDEKMISVKLIINEGSKRG